MELKDRVIQIAESVCKERNIHLVEVQTKFSKQQVLFRVYVDTESGITLGECEKVSRKLLDLIDMDENFPRNYRLDVSSPGLDRPLKTDFDFKKNINQMINAVVLDGAKKKQYSGRLVHFDGDFIYLQPDKGDEFALPRETLEHVKIKLKW
jgi:ribosome maturation factor RimP